MGLQKGTAASASSKTSARARECVEYDERLTYGLYQIDIEVNSSEIDEDIFILGSIYVTDDVIFALTEPI